jgi:hypothetical protein
MMQYSQSSQDSRKMLSKDNDDSSDHAANDDVVVSSPSAATVVAKPMAPADDDTMCLRLIMNARKLRSTNSNNTSNTTNTTNTINTSNTTNTTNGTNMTNVTNVTNISSPYNSSNKERECANGIRHSASTPALTMTGKPSSTLLVLDERRAKLASVMAEHVEIAVQNPVVLHNTDAYVAHLRASMKTALAIFTAHKQSKME